MEEWVAVMFADWCSSSDLTLLNLALTLTTDPTTTTITHLHQRDTTHPTHHPLHLYLHLPPTYPASFSNPPPSLSPNQSHFIISTGQSPQNTQAPMLPPLYTLPLSTLPSAPYSPAFRSFTNHLFTSPLDPKSLSQHSLIPITSTFSNYPDPHDRSRAAHSFSL